VQFPDQQRAVVGDHALATTKRGSLTCLNMCAKMRWIGAATHLVERILEAGVVA
jgi:hypothetical protein